MDDILSAEDDYLTIPRENQIMYHDNYTNEPNPTDPNAEDNLMQIEFLKEMKSLHILDDELLYNDLDFLQSNHIFNMNPHESECVNDRNEEPVFDFTEKSVDQDIMNALYHVKEEQLPELLNVPDIIPEPPKDVQHTSVSVDECATIFESDVDLDASTNLAANLNQLIGENSVQYISTEDDDMFIISLNSEIDAVQLTDMLNIGVEVVNPNDKKTELENQIIANTKVIKNIEPVIVKVEEKIAYNEDANIQMESKQNVKTKGKTTLFVCSTCNKIFKRKNNYTSHIGKYTLNWE